MQYLGTKESMVVSLYYQINSNYPNRGPDRITVPAGLSYIIIDLETSPRLKRAFAPLPIVFYDITFGKPIPVPTPDAFKVFRASDTRVVMISANFRQADSPLHRFNIYLETENGTEVIDPDIDFEPDIPPG